MVDIWIGSECMYITTAGRTNQTMIEKAIHYSEKWNIPYIERNKLTVKQLQDRWKDDLIVVGKERLELYFFGELEPFFFHPNSAMFRIKRLMKQETDPFIEACGLELGSSFLDCTFGMGSDSIVASFVTGDRGKTIGIEWNRYIALIVKEGLKTWNTNIPEINAAMNKIEVIHGDHLHMLKQFPTNSFDCVYFDPMFDEHITESNGIHVLSKVAMKTPFTTELIEEAKRVAKKRVVLKDHYKSERFSLFHFEQNVRKTSKFHYGVIHVNAH